LLTTCGKQVNVQIPEFIPDSKTRPTVSAAYRLPISAVRLVHPLKDPETGAVRDVIIRQLARSRVLWDRHTGYRAWRRYVPGLNVTIPWPERDNPERRDQLGDTPRAAVEERTFVPTLLRPPMPGGVIDELRNRYSRFRTRHEDWYVAKKEAEAAAKKASKEVPDSMLTPIDELRRLRLAEKRARPEPELSDEMLEKIGQVIARNKAAALNAAGLSEILSTGGASPVATDPSFSTSGSASPETRPPLQ
jgi:large subunit ribosomal protein L24